MGFKQAAARVCIWAAIHAARAVPSAGVDNGDADTDEKRPFWFLCALVPAMTLRPLSHL